MLLFWDIHCTSAIIDDLLDSMKTHIDSNNHEQSIVFLWDYVYHFSYDRKALLKLFRFFVWLAHWWKNVYVLAGNHDWISNHFVFSEGATLLDLLDADVWSWTLEFITTPIYKEIEQQRILFFPYCTLPETDYPIKEWWPYQFLLDSENANEQRSWRANSLLDSLIEKHAEGASPLLVMHHWYTHNVSFPWQFAKFSWRSPALSETLLDDDRIYLISWHLHQPFGYKNYCCLWSIWSTSPLELNQIKYFFTLSTWEKWIPQLVATETHQNPYISLPYSWLVIEKEALYDRVKTVREDAQDHLQSWTIPVSFSATDFPYTTCSLQIICEEVLSQWLEEYCGTDVLALCKDIKIKTKRRAMGELLEELQDASLSLDSSISDRKILLERFLKSRYGDVETVEYQKVLQKLWIL